ncbi:histidinol-phosphatase HisJ family protein [Garciella nitratireducens]|uniref:Histidinol-phosphatase n=1 Tax=Garciella nitratireducens DSM 15102 TaxID=1121911 RepID=A0A1T4KNE4_9FIRM|nr:histidinol-phosphatase HisJ family protein [Garciella nitratireducens]RBP40282.1 histidinol-phosphatase (PHP family) [Garciella nitratireducens]SJZ43888.1 histidinol-phosphatase (PHP family) [Garciella nitratireducens DSM 15102]
MYYDYHVHSNFSTDCSIEMEDMVKNAIDTGLKEITFTDHYDQDYKDNTIVFDLDIESYNKELDRLKEKYASEIRIKKGIELGVQPHILKNLKNFVSNYDFDFIIASMHTCNQRDLHVGDFFSNQSPIESYRKYYEELYFCGKHFEEFNVIGHLDLPKRYSNHTPPQKAELFFDILEELFKELIHRGKGIEINTSGLHSPCNESLPSKQILKLYRSLGGEIITLGSDSHYPEHLGYGFMQICEMLKNLGFRYITTFEKQKPTFIKIP